VLKQTILEKKLGRIAIICDQMTSFGGAEREMFSMMELFPSADIFTIIYFEEKFPNNKYNVRTSFVQKFPFKKRFANHLKILTPLAYESFNLSDYDFIISISAGSAKSVITGIDQPHVAMTMTPPRSLWENEISSKGSVLRKIYRPIAKMVNSYFRVWDYTASKRVNYWTANSYFIKEKIKKTYGVDAEVIYPGIGKDWYKEPTEMEIKKVKAKYHFPKHFALVLSRLYNHKRIDWAIKSCQESNTPLYIIGEGPDRKNFEKLVKESDEIHFLGRLSDKEAIVIYHLSDVVLFCSVEDFGLVPVEAMAAGTPVLAYGVGGVTETVKEGITGEFFKTNGELTTLLKNFDRKRYNRDIIKKHALQFSEEKFQKNLVKYLTKIYEEEHQRS